MGIERVKNGYRARKYVDGKQVTIRNPDRPDGKFDTKKQARMAIMLHEPPPEAKANLEGLAKQWLEKHPRPSPVTNSGNTHRLKVFTDSFGHLYPHELSPDLLRAWVSKHTSAARTVKLMLKEMDHPELFHKIKIKRSHGLAKIVPFNEPDPDKRIEVVQRLAEIGGNEIFPEFGYMIEFAAYTGLRPQEQLVLMFEDVNVPRSELYVRRRLERTGKILEGGKGGKPRTIALLPEAEEAIRSTAPFDTSPYVWNSQRGMLNFETHWRYWKIVRTKAGLPEGKAGRWYMLRHFFATYLLELGARPWDIGLQMGHEDGSLVEKLYGHPSTDRASARIMQLADQRTGNNVVHLR